ncbi:hypothetical protein FKP32DRAFT_1212127 [Trametes sanguinea]|nr:hypothetical protein FKP32DRAFT_1212127 [Trametes sanguinea]
MRLSTTQLARSVNALHRGAHMHPQLCQERHPRSRQFALHSNQVRAPLPSGVQYALHVSSPRSWMFLAAVQCSEGYLHSSPTYAATWSESWRDEWTLAEPYPLADRGSLERMSMLLSGKYLIDLRPSLGSCEAPQISPQPVGTSRLQPRGTQSTISRPFRPLHRWRTSAQKDVRTLVCSDSDSARWQIFVPRADRQLYRPLAIRRTRIRRGCSPSRACSDSRHTRLLRPVWIRRPFGPARVLPARLGPTPPYLADRPPP